MQILEKARQLLDQQVSKFIDEEARRKYNENVPWRRAVESEWLVKKGRL